MEEEVKPVEEAPVEQPQKQEESFKLNPNRPLKSQVDQLLKALPEDPAKEEPKKEETPVEEPQEEVPEEVELEEIPEETKFEPLPDWQKYIIDNLPTIQVMGH